MQVEKLHLDQEFASAGLRLYRKRAVEPMLGRVVTPATDRSVLVGLSLGTDHRRRIFHSNHSSLHDFGRNAVYVRNFSDDYPHGMCATNGDVINPDLLAFIKA